MTKHPNILHAGDELALPKAYLSDQPDLESHAATYYQRVEKFQVRVIDRIHRLLDGEEPVLNSTLDELEKHWIFDLKRLTHSKDELNDKHFHRPLEVSLLWVVQMVNKIMIMIISMPSAIFSLS